MPRAKGGYKTRRRRKKLLQRAKGFWGRRKNTYKVAKETVHRSLRYQYRDRRRRKREFRTLWIQRINAGARGHHMTYAQLMHGLRLSGSLLDRKVLADLAVNDSAGFQKLVENARQALKLPPPPAA
ncbi:MAG: 50S ribosomal protein L20 [Nitrospirae bacterium]|nr:50S ribosomal protein L20 [Nitrospirota bacterium]